MASALIRESLAHFSCPQCSSQKLLLTKEKIIVCGSCLNGYRVIDGVPDFRVERAISLRQSLKKTVQGVSVKISAETDELISSDVAELKLNHCLVLGRHPMALSEDQTIVGRPQDEIYGFLSPSDLKLIEGYLVKNSNQKESQVPMMARQKVLGQFVRDPDVRLNEPSVSKLHAVIYQDERGVHLLDLVSKNGTFVNGHEIEHCTLRSGDRVNLGQAVIRVDWA